MTARIRKRCATKQLEITSQIEEIQLRIRFLSDTSLPHRALKVELEAQKIELEKRLQELKSNRDRQRKFRQKRREQRDFLSSSPFDLTASSFKFISSPESLSPQSSTSSSSSPDSTMDQTDLKIVEYLVELTCASDSVYKSFVECHKELLSKHENALLKLHLCRIQAGQLCGMNGTESAKVQMLQWIDELTKPS